MRILNLTSLLATILIITSCGNNNTSTPKGDGKGKIDIVDYLPSQDMKKEFSYSYTGATMYGGSGREEIEVIDNRINITKYVDGSTSPDGYTVLNESINYDDKSIVGFYKDFSTDFPVDTNVTYRHIDKGEILFSNESDTASKYEYYDDNIDSTYKIGNKHTKISSKCVYNGITDKVFDSYGKIKKEEGNFLVVKCDKLFKNTYTVDSEYRDLVDIHNKSDYEEVESFLYYEKGIGFIGQFAYKKVTDKPCKTKSKCQYLNDYHYDYYIHTIEEI